MSLLAADIGNSHTFLGLLDADEVTGFGPMGELQID